MNCIFRSIWNDSTGTFVAVPENAKSAGKKTSSCTSATGANGRFALKALTLSLMLSFGVNVYALPVNGVVSAGNASIGSAAGSTTITQTSQNVAINWQSFSIAAGETVRFIQPNSSSVALNRVWGSDPSSILGNLSANGKVFLVNPNGILFGQGAQVNVGGLVASTLNITDSNFMAGVYKFTGAGGTVLNQGTIKADGGYVALLGASVSNDGTISARLGTVAMAAGTAITLDIAGDGLLNITVNQGAVNALIQNGGMIQADGGQVLLTTQAAGDLLQSSVNNTGVIQAQTLESHNGTIKLLGDMQSGTVNVGGTLDASAPNGGNGGFVETSAAHVKIQANTIITTSAVQGITGNWLIDPVDYTIAAATGDITGAQLSANLGTSNVTILSSSGAVGVNGDITVADTVTWSANKLTLNAQRNININAPMNGSGTASLSLLYGQATAGGGASTYNILAPVNLPAGPNFTTQLGAAGVPTNYTVITSLGAEGSVTGTDLQGINGNQNGHYALGSNIDASPTVGWNGGFGFDPIGHTIADPFTGNFDGLGHAITGLTIARPVTNNVGLFGYVVSAGGAMLKNVTLSGGSVSGGLYVGSLVGHIDGDILNSHSTQGVAGTGYRGGIAGWSTGNITNSTATGPVTGTGDYVGGLVGWITGNIDCCYSTAPVTSTGSYVGGMAGWVTGNITRSYATGNVNTAALYAGGLAGWVTGNTSNSYALGSVTTAGGNVGGLIGWNDGLINNTFSSGAVSGAVPVGGLVGFMNGGTVTNSFWDTTTSGQLLSAGGAGAKGMPTIEMKKQVNFTTATPANAPLSPIWDFSGIWAMVTDGATYPSLLACLVPATWTAVPAPPVVPPVVPPIVPPIEPPVEPPVEPPEGVVPVPDKADLPIAEEMMGGETVVGGVPRLGVLPARLTSVVLAKTPAQLATVFSPFTPPVVVPEPLVAKVESSPQVYVAPPYLPKQDRN